MAKAVTVVISIAAVLILIAAFSKRQPQGSGLKVEKLNDKFRDTANLLRKAVLTKDGWKKKEKRDKREQKLRDKNKADKATKSRLFVVDFKGDIRATAVANLREEISAILAVAGDRDEVVVRLENPGGAVHEHGLAASQLLRVKNKGVPLTVIVDKVAASGGYLMACIANRIVAAPFAVIGSIGVLAQIPNFHRALEERGVDFEQVTAGKYKRTVTMFGKTTEEGRAKLKEELEEVHGLFKGMVSDQRPSLDVESISTGEHWYGTRALELGLIDVLGSSDDYLLDAAETADVFHVTWRGKATLQERLLSAFESSVEALRGAIARF